ncbi:MAG: hypothetical protein AMXMBFR7_40860 [Planctomycetota bacterium]
MRRDPGRERRSKAPLDPEAPVSQIQFVQHMYRIYGVRFAQFHGIGAPESRGFEYSARRLAPVREPDKRFIRV